MRRSTDTSTVEQRAAQAEDYRRLFHESYLRCVVSDQDGFFKRFYELFTAADPAVAEVFALTDMDRQVSMLQESLLYLIGFANSKIASERMKQIAEFHGSSGIGVPAYLFDLWLDCLVDTAGERDTAFDPQIEAAWRVFLASGIAFFKLHCSR